MPLTEVPAVIVRPQTENPAAVAAGEPPPVIDLTGANLAGLSQVVHLSDQLPRLSTGQIALASGFARQYRLHPGSTITLNSANGDVTLTVAGTYTDPSGLFVQDGLVTSQTMALLTADAPVTSILVRAARHTSSAALATALARAVAGVPVARAYTRAGLVDHLASSDIREFNLLYVFLAMAVFVALFGLGTTVSLNVVERTREFGLLAAVGATSRQIRSIVRWETATVGPDRLPARRRHRPRDGLGDPCHHRLPVHQPRPAAVAARADRRWIGSRGLPIVGHAHPARRFGAHARGDWRVLSDRDRSSRSSADSAVLVPGFLPSSISAWRTHLRSVCALPMPSRFAISPIAAHSDG